MRSRSTVSANFSPSAVKPGALTAMIHGAATMPITITQTQRSRRQRFHQRGVVVEPRAQRAANLARQHTGLELLAPQRTLERGYAVLLDAKGHAIRDPNALHARARIEARLAQGAVDIEIAQVQPKLDM